MWRDLFGKPRGPSAELASTLADLDRVARDRPELASPAKALERVLTAVFAVPPRLMVPYDFCAESPWYNDVSRAWGAGETAFGVYPPSFDPDDLRERSNAISKALKAENPAAATLVRADLDWMRIATSMAGGDERDVEEVALSLRLPIDLMRSIARLTVLPVLARCSAELAPHRPDSLTNVARCPNCGRPPSLAESARAGGSEIPAMRRLRGGVAREPIGMRRVRRNVARRDAFAVRRGRGIAASPRGVRHLRQPPQGRLDPRPLSAPGLVVAELARASGLLVIVPAGAFPECLPRVDLERSGFGRRADFWVPLVVHDQCPDGRAGALVGYDQWHPKSPATLKRESLQVHPRRFAGRPRWLLGVRAGARAPDEPERRALAFLGREVPQWQRENRCFSCHNNGDGRTSALRFIEFADRSERGRPGGDPRIPLATGTLGEERGRCRVQRQEARPVAIRLGRWPLPRVPDGSSITACVVQAADLLAMDQAEDGSWPIDEATAVGSPATYGPPLATAVAIRALRRADAKRFRGAISRAESWLRRRPIENVQDASALLLAITGEAASDRKVIGEALAFLVRAQNDDGGWGPFRRSASEPFDTARRSSLPPRHRIGGMSGSSSVEDEITSSRISLTTEAGTRRPAHRAARATPNESPPRAGPPRRSWRPAHSELARTERFSVAIADHSFGLDRRGPQ